MKKDHRLIIVAITILLLTYINPFWAEERYKVYEMADGATVSFPMTAEEIAEEDAEKANAAIARKVISEKPQIRYKVYEMADGATISFPMTAEEIAKEDVKYNH